MYQVRRWLLADPNIDEEVKLFPLETQARCMVDIMNCIPNKKYHYYYI